MASMEMIFPDGSIITLACNHNQKQDSYFGHNMLLTLFGYVKKCISNSSLFSVYWEENKFLIRHISCITVSEDSPADKVSTL